MLGTRRAIVTVAAGYSPKGRTGFRQSFRYGLGQGIGALLHLGRHRLALIDDTYGQASDGGLARIDRLVDFPLNYQVGLLMEYQEHERNHRQNRRTRSSNPPRLIELLH